MTYLSVHEDINDGVVDGGALGKVGRHGCCQWVEGIAWVCSSKAGEECVRSPANTVGQDHDNHHSGHFFLCFLCGLRILLLLGDLLERNDRGLVPFFTNWNKLLKAVQETTYSMDGQPHSNVAENDNGQRENTAGDHQDNHVGLDTRVLASTEDIRPTGGL